MSVPTNLNIREVNYNGVNIPLVEPETQTKTVTPTTAGVTVTPDAGKLLSSVTVNGDADLVAGNIKSGVNIFGVDGTLQPAKTEQSKTLTLGAAAPVTVTPDSGKVLSSVPVSIDTNVIKAENIAKDVTMLGITGTHEGGGGGDLEKFISEQPTTAIFPTVSTIRNYAFYSCTSLTTASFPSCTTIGYNAFCNCISLTTASFPVCTSIDSYAFRACTSLTTASFPSCTTIGNSAFYACNSLTTASFPSCTTIGAYAFRACNGLTTASFPSCTTIGAYAFGSCEGLTTASFPSCTSIGDNAFGSCYILTTVSLPACTSIGNSAFYYCVRLTTVSLPACTSIGNSAFYRCFNLLSLYLTGSSYVTLSASTAFTSTPIGGYTTSTGGVYGSIYVPASMLNSYMTGTNWSYFSSRFVGV